MHVGAMVHSRRSEDSFQDLIFYREILGIELSSPASSFAHWTTLPCPLLTFLSPLSHASIFPVRLPIPTTMQIGPAFSTLKHGSERL